jgi:YVTN family beta-propeller protein
MGVRFAGRRNSGVTARFVALAVAVIFVVVALLASGAATSVVGRRVAGGADVPRSYATPDSTPPYVGQTLVLLNDSLIPGNFIANGGELPEFGAYDSGKGTIYVATAQADVVDEISGATHEVNAAIVVGPNQFSFPFAAAYDPAHGEVFVTDSGTNEVSVINDSSNTVVATINVGVDPLGIALDPVLDELFVANSGSNSVSVLSAASNSVVASVTVGDVPYGVVYDSANADVYVTNSQDGNISAISAASNTVSQTVTVGLDPYGIAYDSGQGELFVADEGSGSVTVVSDVSDTSVANISLGSGLVSPDGLAYDSAQGEVFVADTALNSVGVISDVTNIEIANLTVGTSPSGIVYDGALGEVYVSNFETNNVSVLAGSTGDLVATTNLAYTPSGVAYDPAKGEIFVTNDESQGVVSVISDTSNQIVATVNVGQFPVAAAYDPANAEVFVSNSGSNSVSVIDVANNSVISTVQVGASPFGIAYDSGKGQVWVANSGAGTVSVINATYDSVLTSPTVGESTYAPEAVAYDPSNGFVYVTDYAEQMVSVMSDSLDVLYSEFSVADGPDGIVYDPGTSELFVANSLSDNVSVVSTATQTQIASVPVGSAPSGVVYDGSAGDVLVLNANSSNVTVIADSNNTVVANDTVGADPQYAVTDTGTQRIYVGDTDSDSLSVLTSTRSTSSVATFTETGLPVGAQWYVNITGKPVLTATVTHTAGTQLSMTLANGEYNYTAATDENKWSTTPSGTFTASGVPVGVAVPFTLVTYLVTAVESGLPIGATWYFNITGQAGLSATVSPSFGTSISTALPNASYTYATTTTQQGWSTPPTGGFTVAGAPVPVSVPFTSPGSFAVTATESGLPNGAEWYFNISGQAGLFATVSGYAGTAVSTELLNATYSYETSAGWKNWSTTPTGGFTVAGAAVPVSVPFHSIEYPVTINESGLPSGVTWYFNVSGQPSVLTNVTATSGTSASLSLQNGTYSYTTATEPMNWNASTGQGFSVAGSPVSVNLTFSSSSPGPYLVTFTDSGLPASAAWFVNVTGQAGLSGWSNTNLTLTLPDGTYQYAVATGEKAWSTTSTGSFVINGAPQLVRVAFAPVLFSVTFSESQLPAGATWYVNISGQPSLAATILGSAGTSISVRLQNGSYQYAASANLKGYASPTGGFSVAGGSAAVALSFRAGASGGGTFLGMPDWEWLILGAGVVAVLALLVVLSRRRRRPVEDERAYSPA